MTLCQITVHQILRSVFNASMYSGIIFVLSLLSNSLIQLIGIDNILELCALVHN